MIAPSALRGEYQRRRREAGLEPGSWFDPGWFRFFGTRLEEVRAELPDGTILFLSSEQPPDGGRRFSVRAMSPSGEIETLGPFAEMDRTDARLLAERFAVESFERAEA